MNRDLKTNPGRIPHPTVEIVAKHDGEIDPAARLRPLSVGHFGRLRRFIDGLRATDPRHANRPRRDRFVIDSRSASPEILAGRSRHALLALDADERPVLRVLQGMRGELRVGVSVMTVAQMLDDPALRDVTGSGGAASLPLPYGARLRIDCGRTTFHARVGGPPLVQAPPEDSPAAAAESSSLTPLTASGTS